MLSLNSTLSLSTKCTTMSIRFSSNVAPRSGLGPIIISISFSFVINLGGTAASRSLNENQTELLLDGARPKELTRKSQIKAMRKLLGRRLK